MLGEKNKRKRSELNDKLGVDSLMRRDEVRWSL